MLDLKEYYENEISWLNHQIEWHNEQIAYGTKRLQTLRKEDEDLRREVWSYGPLTRLQASIWGTKEISLKHNKEYQQELKTRKHNYKWRKRYTARLADYTEKLEDLNNGRIDSSL